MLIISNPYVHDKNQSFRIRNINYILYIQSQIIINDKYSRQIIIKNNFIQYNKFKPYDITLSILQHQEFDLPDHNGLMSYWFK